MTATAVHRHRPATLVGRATPALPIGGWSKVMLVTAALMGVLAFAWPLFLRPGALLGADTLAPLILAALLPLVLGVVVVQLSQHELDVKGLALVGILTAMGAVTRPLGAGTAGFETVFFLVIIGGRVFGPGFGFVLGNTTLFASALIVGGSDRGCRTRCWRPGSPGWWPGCCPGWADAPRSRCSLATVPSPDSSSAP